MAKQFIFLVAVSVVASIVTYFLIPAIAARVAFLRVANVPNIGDGVSP